MHLKSKNNIISLKEMVIFALLGAMMFTSKWITEILPNVHLLGVFTVAFTAVYRFKALFPIYVFVLLMGVFTGFANWWIPYLYLWLILWLFVMIIPQKLNFKVKTVLYIAVCSIHGFLYGVLYAPVQAIMFGYDFKTTVAWVITGLPWDLVHGISNAICALLIPVIIKALNIANQKKVL